MTDVIAFVGGSAVLIGAIAWLARSIVLHMLDKDADRHRELLRASISQRSRLHEERCIVIRDIYANLVDLIEKTHGFVHPAEWVGEPSKDEKRKDVAVALVKFQEHFERNKLYLSPELCDRIQGFVDSFLQPALQFAFYLSMSKTNQGEKLVKEFHESWFAAYDKIKKEVPMARKALEDEFRAILGIKDVLPGA
jgi:hypothetical protein